jgi:tetratricopeptide (TPR) repeat protein
MHRFLLVSTTAWVLLVASAADAARDSTPRQTATDATVAVDDVQERIVDLIKQLGDEQYAVRRRAEDELLRLGPDAFDQLKLAENDMDLEIAERARYIVQRLRVEWVRPDDSPDIRRTLARYGDLSEPDRLKRIARLAEMKDDEGLPALCRIARLEMDPRIARRAALAVLKRKSPEVVQPKVAEACRQELGGSERASVLWLHLWLRELDDRKAALAGWNEAIDAERTLLDQESPETNFDIVYALMKRRLDTCHDLRLVDETTASLLEIVELGDADTNAQQLAANLAWAMRWLIDNQRWDVLDQVDERYRDQLRDNRKLLYYLAAAKSRADDKQESAELSTQAFEMAVEDPGERVELAGSLAEMGFIDWAEREYRKAIDDLPVVSLESLEARRHWAMWLHDREQYKEAADVIGEFFDGLAEDDQARRRLFRQGNGRQFLNAINARREFYLACHYESRKEYDRQRETLKKAAALYDDDPDILIAMYRSSGADEAFRKETITKIQEMSQRHLMLIEQYPEEPSFHNQWAWLISNTEGDYAKAVEHSLKSLELSPEEPSYLDTLARCYYATGDLEKAVESQRRAVELAPHYGVMRRQLDQFERELSEKRASGR